MGSHLSTGALNSSNSFFSSSEICTVTDPDDLTFGTNDGEIIDYKITSLPSWSPASWMGDLAPHIGSTPLMQLRMVGSHDSTTSTITENSEVAPDAEGFIAKLYSHSSAQSVMRRVVPGWCLCQDLTVLQQLEQGVRYLDYRLCPNLSDNGNMWHMHSLYAQPLRNTLSQVTQFIDRHPHEFVMLDMQHVDFMNISQQSYERLASELFVLDSYALPTSFVTSTTTLNDIYNLGGGTRRVLVLIEDQDHLDHLPATMKSWITPRDNALQDVFYNKSTAESLMDVLRKSWNEYQNSDSSDTTASQFSVLQSVVTPSDNSIVTGLFNYGPDSVRKLTSPYMTRMLKFYASCAATPMRVKVTQAGGQLWKNRGNQFQNIVLLDYFEDYQMMLHHERSPQEATAVSAVELCVLLNIELAEKNRPLSDGH